MELFLSSKIIICTFTASTLTTIGICYYYNVPFFNPKHNTYQFRENLRRVIPSALSVLTQAIFVNALLVGTFIENKPHTLYQNIDNV